MFLRIAHRTNRTTTIQAHESLEDYFAGGAFFDVTYLEAEKSLLVTKSPDGKSQCHVPNDYKKDGYTRAFHFTALPAWLPAFSINEAEFAIDDDMLIWRRPPVWQLGWSQRASSDLREAARCATTGFKARIDSARRNGVDLQRVTQAVPAWARSVIRTADWMAIVHGTFNTD